MRNFSFSPTFVKMRFGIFLCVCVLVVALSEARSLSRNTLKARLLSKLAARMEEDSGVDATGERNPDKDGGEKGNPDEDGGKTETGEPPQRKLSTATLQALLFGVQCMMIESFWKSLPEEAWKSEDWSKDFSDTEWYKSDCMQSIFGVIHYVTQPEDRKEMDRIYRAFVEAVKCEMMDNLDKRLEDAFGTKGADGEVTFPEELKFIGVANRLMRSHCENRMKEREEFLEKLAEENDDQEGNEGQQAESAKPQERNEGQQAESTKPQEGNTVDKKSFDMMLRNLLSSVLELREEELPKERQMSTAGIQAVEFAGNCLLKNPTMTEMDEDCTNTIMIVAYYVKVFDEKSWENVDWIEYIFETYVEKFTCDELLMARDRINRAIEGDDTFVKGVLLYNIKFVLGFQQLTCDHCAAREVQFALLTQEEKRKRKFEVPVLWKK